MVPASTADRLDFHTMGDDQTKGTGVYAFPRNVEDDIQCARPREIASQNISREAWARELGTGLAYYNQESGSADLDLLLLPDTERDAA